MIIKKQFDLLQGVQNTLNLSSVEIKSAEIENGPRKAYVVLELMKKRITHFTKDKVFSLIQGLKARQSLSIVVLEDYSLPVSYNYPTNSIVINLSPFGIDDILSTKPGPIDLYAALVYGITMREIINKKVKISDSHAAPIASFLHAIFMKGFGKEYGLLGSFTGSISVLKFLTNSYVLASFFGITGISNYRRSSTGSGVDYREYKEKLDKYDFTNINDFILALADFRVFPNINKHFFANRILRQFTIEFLPALEDIARFISVITTSDITGTTLAPTYIKKYNERSYSSILEISKIIFS
jgi:hypothetical protein